ncbi:MAG TPA: hypothetical protein VGO50_15105 [Pyrinomonadaceae bacterium]|jgi:hypothetical protein|nr:hypothetical protein [Pyrinomonadaceae bacterium]
MSKLFKVILIILVLAVCGFAQSTVKANPSLEATMKKFIRSIETKNTSVFLSFISRKDGLRIMNTIDQGEAGNADKPVLDSTLSYRKLSADLAKKGGYYRDIFIRSKEDPDFYDAFARRKEKWILTGGNKFMLWDKTERKPSNLVYLKWKKSGAAWVVIEAARMIS